MKLLAVTAACLVAAMSTSRAHDIYSNLYSDGGQGSGRPGTHWCCNGDAERGDCEAIGENFHFNDDGTVVMHSNRYKRDVLVGKDKVVYLPVEGGEASVAHWCGKPRAALTYTPGSVNDDQPDTETWTYCAFIAPGGS
jgi:hypothetical protein